MITPTTKRQKTNPPDLHPRDLHGLAKDVTQAADLFDDGQAVLAKVIELNQAKKLTLKKNKPEEPAHSPARRGGTHLRRHIEDGSPREYHMRGGANITVVEFNSSTNKRLRPW